MATYPANRDRQSSLDDYFNLTPAELHETIEFLIQHRQLLRDEEIERLHAEARTLRSRVEELDRRALVEELECFKDVLALHRRLAENGNARR